MPQDTPEAGIEKSSRDERCRANFFLVVCYSLNVEMPDDARSVLAALADTFCGDRHHLADEEYNGGTEAFDVCVILAMVEREERHRVPLYVENVVPTYLEFDSGDCLACRGILWQPWSPNSNTPNSPRRTARTPQNACICLPRRQLIALSYVGTSCTMYMIGHKFDVSESSVHATDYRVIVFFISISRREI